MRSIAISSAPSSSRAMRWLFHSFSNSVRGAGSGSGGLHLAVHGPPVARHQPFLDRSARFQLAIADPVPGAAAALPVVGKLDHLVKIKARVAGALPIEHHRAVVLIKRHFGGPALYEIIVPPDTLVAISGRKVADFLSPIIPGVM